MSDILTELVVIVARPMRLLSRVAAPIVKLLTGPTNLVLRLFGIRVSSEPSITVEEILARSSSRAPKAVSSKTPTTRSCKAFSAFGTAS